MKQMTSKLSVASARARACVVNRTSCLLPPVAVSVAPVSLETMIGRDTPYIVVDDSDDNNDDDSRNSDDDSRHRIFTDDEDDSGYGDMSTRASPLASTVGSDWATVTPVTTAQGHLFLLFNSMSMLRR